MTSDQFKKIRTKLNMSQTQLAEEIGITRVTVSRYETSYSQIPKNISIVMNCLMSKLK